MQKRILIVKRGAMGDILMATPFLRQLRTVYPQAEIDFITTTSFANVLINNPYISKIITLNDKVFYLKHIFVAIKYFLTLRNKYDYVFALDKHYYFNFLTVIVGGVRIGYVRENISKLFLNKYVIYNDINRYHGLYYLDLLQKLGYQPNYKDLSLDFFVDDVTQQTKDFLLNLGRGIKYVVVINSGGNNAYEHSGIRMLPPLKIIELLTNLLRSYSVVLIGSNVDKNNYDSYVKIINNSRLYNLAGQLSLSDSAYVLKQAVKVYTTDCGAMHLAISQNCASKMVCFFGPTNPNHVLPPNQEITTYWSDEDIYDPNYALSGSISQANVSYFTNLYMKQITLYLPLI